jgi:hypothetical protein
MKSEFYALFHAFLPAPRREMAPRHHQLRAPRVTASGNALQALVDPPNIRNEDHDDGGDESMEGTYLNSIANAARAGTLPLESAQHFSFYAETFKLLMKEFTERAEEHLQDVSSSAIRTQQAIQAVSA